MIAMTMTELTNQPTNWKNTSTDQPKEKDEKKRKSSDLRKKGNQVTS